MVDAGNGAELIKKILMTLSKTETKTLGDAIKNIKTCMLTTSKNGVLHSRPMAIVQDDFKEYLYLYTKKEEAKVNELLEHPNICISFCDHKNHEHVSISGVCIISHSEDLIDKYWSPFVAAWFPNGKKSAAIIACKVEKAEIWDCETSAMKVLYELAKANLTHKEPNIGKNIKLGQVDIDLKPSTISTQIQQ